MYTCERDFTHSHTSSMAVTARVITDRHRQCEQNYVTACSDTWLLLNGPALDQYSLNNYPTEFHEIRQGLVADNVRHRQTEGRGLQTWRSFCTEHWMTHTSLQPIHSWRWTLTTLLQYSSQLLSKGTTAAVHSILPVRKQQSQKPAAMQHNSHLCTLKRKTVLLCNLQ